MIEESVRIGQEPIHGGMTSFTISTGSPQHIKTVKMAKENSCQEKTGNLEILPKQGHLLNLKVRYIAIFVITFHNCF